MLMKALGVKRQAAKLEGATQSCEIGKLHSDARGMAMHSLCHRCVIHGCVRRKRENR